MEYLFSKEMMLDLALLDSTRSTPLRWSGSFSLLRYECHSKDILRKSLSQGDSFLLTLFLFFYKLSVAFLFVGL